MKATVATTPISPCGHRNSPFETLKPNPAPGAAGEPSSYLCCCPPTPGTYNRGGQGLDISPYNGVVPRYYWNVAVNPDPVSRQIQIQTLARNACT